MVNEYKAYKKIFHLELKNILEYWMQYGVDNEKGGFYGAVDLAGKADFSASRSSVLNTRILWTFAAAAREYPDERYQKMAERALDVIDKNFRDPVYGGYYMEIDADSQLVSDIKHTYAQAFSMYSLCKYYELDPKPEVLEMIREDFFLLEEKTKDPKNPGYYEAFTRDWKPIEENRMADNNEPKSMNTHLHIMEAYTSLYKVWKDDRVKLRLRELLILFLEKIIRKDGHLGIFFSEDFCETGDSKAICSFGHDIEASWLLWEAVQVLGDQDLIEKMKVVCIKMAKAVVRVGLDKDGGLFLESTRHGSHVRTNKHWWLQAEALVGLMNLYELSGDNEYWEMTKKTWSFIDTYLIDHEGGEWFTKLNRLGVPYLIEPADDPSPYYRNDRKIDPWKCPYHNGRAMMEMIQRIERVCAEEI